MVILIACCFIGTFLIGCFWLGYIAGKHKDD